jgi:hypothetical protein
MKLVRWLMSEEATYVGDRFVLAVCLVALVLFLVGAIS